MKLYLYFNTENRMLTWVGANSFLVTFLELFNQLKCQRVPFFKSHRHWSRYSEL